MKSGKTIGSLVVRLEMGNASPSKIEWETAQDGATNSNLNNRTSRATKTVEEIRHEVCGLKELESILSKLEKLKPFVVVMDELSKVFFSLWI